MDAPRVLPRFLRGSALALVTAIALAALWPGIVHVGDPAAPPIPAAETPPEERLVRVSAPGGVLVYDKERSWTAAKSAELFPSLATRLLPADFVATEDGGLRPARSTLRGPWWSGTPRLRTGADDALTDR